MHRHSNGRQIRNHRKSGCGKSTLIDILIGLTAPDKGKVIVNGHDIQTRNEQILKNWRSSIALVPQDTFLIDDSIMKNIPRRYINQ